jgi:hypothetical protein
MKKAPVDPAKRVNILEAMTSAEIELYYERVYRGIGFERAGLFEHLGKRYRPRKAAYIGSSIHVTPSFYLKNVTYVDDSALAQSFFSNARGLAAFIEANKRYRGRAAFEYADLDYRKARVPAEGDYDLALSILAPHSLERAVSCVRRGGVVVYLPLPSMRSSEEVRRLVRRVGLIVHENGRYEFSRVPDREGPQPRTTLRHVTGGRFVEKNSYPVFVKK